MWHTDSTYPMKLANNTQNKTPLSKLITKEYFPQVAMQLENLRQAVALAQDPKLPDRVNLYQIYEKTLKDLHLRSQIRTALYTIQFAPFEIRRDGLPDDDLTQLFDRTWFDEFIRFVFETELWGHSLIEFSVIADNEVKEINLIPRQNVVPELGLVRISIYDQPDQGIKYTDKMLRYRLIEIGNPFDLGLLELASIAVIWKTYSLSDWAEYMDRYGFPFLIMQTNTTDDTELRKMQQMGDYFGFVRYIILSKEDDVKVEHARGFAGDHNIFDVFIERMDKYLSKLINGQTATSDEKSFVGSAEVQERILNKYTLARLRRIQRIINDKLIPFLTYLGYPLQNARFQYLDLELASTIDTPQQKKTPR